MVYLALGVRVVNNRAAAPHSGEDLKSKIITVCCSSKRATAFRRDADASRLETTVDWIPTHDLAYHGSHAVVDVTKL